MCWIRQPVPFQKLSIRHDMTFLEQECEEHEMQVFADTLHGSFPQHLAMHKRQCRFIWSKEAASERMHSKDRCLQWTRPRAFQFPPFLVTFFIDNHFTRMLQ